MKQFEKEIFKKINFNIDLENNKDNLTQNIFNQNILVIGGAGTIGASYIKQILKYRPSK